MPLQVYTRVTGNRPTAIASNPCPEELEDITLSPRPERDSPSRTRLSAIEKATPLAGAGGGLDREDSSDLDDPARYSLSESVLDFEGYRESTWKGGKILLSISIAHGRPEHPWNVNSTESLTAEQVFEGSGFQPPAVQNRCEPELGVLNAVLRPPNEEEDNEEEDDRPAQDGSHALNDLPEAEAASRDSSQPAAAGPRGPAGPSPSEVRRRTPEKTAQQRLGTANATALGASEQAPESRETMADPLMQQQLLLAASPGDDMGASDLPTGCQGDEEAAPAVGSSWYENGRLSPSHPLLASGKPQQQAADEWVGMSNASTAVALGSEEAHAVLPSPSGSSFRSGQSQDKESVCSVERPHVIAREISEKRVLPGLAFARGESGSSSERWGEGMRSPDTVTSDQTASVTAGVTEGQRQAVTAAVFAVPDSVKFLRRYSCSAAQAHTSLMRAFIGGRPGVWSTTRAEDQAVMDDGFTSALRKGRRSSLLYEHVQNLDRETDDATTTCGASSSPESHSSAFGRTISAPEIGLRRRFLEEQAALEEQKEGLQREQSQNLKAPFRRQSIEDVPMQGLIEPNVAWINARTTSSHLTDPIIPGGGAPHDMLEAVVEQLDTQHASAAAAAVEYLVSSSDPKGPAPDMLRGWRWTSDGAKGNREALGSFPGLWERVLKLLEGDAAEAHAKVCGAMSKLGFRNSSNVLAMIKHRGMLSALTRLLSDEHATKVQVQAWRVLQNCVSGIDEGKVILCSEKQLLDTMKDACTKERDNPEIRMRAVSVIMHASSSDAAKTHLLQARIPEEALRAVMASDAKTLQASATRIRATLASANLCGREERSILSTTPDMLSEIVRCVQHAMEETEYCGIKWSLAGVMLPLFNLSCSDSNKIELITCGTIPLLLKLIQEALPSSEPFELALRTLANFTFNEEAKEQMMEGGALETMNQIIERLQILPEGQAIPARKVAQDLAFMLANTDDGLRDSIEVDPGWESEQARIMISYSWAEKKQNVVALTQMLREKGYDVWRDEDGSQTVQKMMGSSMEIMAQAIEVANFVIVFVSRAYRDSYNCKLEGKYAQTRERAQLVKILFVMMEEDYTPQSEAGVDGWLGMMIADAIWYVGWDADELKSTADKLEKVILKELHQETRGSQPIQRTSSMPASNLSSDSYSSRGPSRGSSLQGSARDLYPLSSPVNVRSRSSSSALAPVVEGQTNRSQGAPAPAAMLKLQNSKRNLTPVPAALNYDPHTPLATTPSTLGPEDDSAEASPETLQPYNGGTPYNGGAAYNSGAPYNGAGQPYQHTLTSDPSSAATKRRNSLNAAQPASEVDDFLWRHGIQELQSVLAYHRIDSLRLIARLSEAHILRLTDRVGLQVRLLEAQEELLNMSQAQTLSPPALAQPSPSVFGRSSRALSDPLAGQYSNVQKRASSLGGVDSQFVGRSGSPRHYLMDSRPGGV